MCAIHEFNTLHMARDQWVNYENIVAFPKRGAEMSISYRSISLIHAIAKKISAKMIAIRLAHLMNDLVSNAQSAFIKVGVSITTSCICATLQVASTNVKFQCARREGCVLLFLGLTLACFNV
jgi:hypothetical protein